ncbi:radical SAM/SPASM domain-containing protein [Lactococcus allomyrinae]|uniref:Radical SAM protein n=1 Tax=Lactococcus allomyrinae TaxID=2419773 RepID=A0A387BGL1_9LACT|nr:radical SAM protein [Lactococcus allomyrinae]AYG01414.1 radical SAM protein [Lactococcus allomyrinae]
MALFTNYVEQVESSDSTILYNFYNGISIKYPHILFKNIEEFSSNSDIYDLLNSEQFLSNNFHFKIIDRTLQLILLIHEDCNFRCTYCYEKFEKGAMSKEIAESVLRFIKKEITENREKYDKIQLSWFGGEPLLNLKIIEFLSDEVLKLARQNDLEYYSDITTNGYLLSPRIFQKLLNLKVNNFQITIDGTQVYHDKQRLLKNGHGTYARIIQNLLSIKKNITDDTVIILRTNVGKENYETMDENISNLISLFGDTENILLFFHNIGNWGEKEIEVVKKDIRLELTKRVIERGGHVVPFIWTMGPDNICYAAKENHYVIGSMGLVYKCTVALYDQRNILGRLDKQGNLLIDRKKEKMWTEVELDEECYSCTLLPSCLNNRCPLNRMTSKQTHYCLPTKGQIEEMILVLDKQNLITYEIGAN